MPEDYSVIVRGVGPCGRGMTVRMRLSGSKLAKPVRRTIVQAYCKHAATKGFAIDRDRVEMRRAGAALDLDATPAVLGFGEGDVLELALGERPAEPAAPPKPAPAPKPAPTKPPPAPKPAAAPKPAPAKPVPAPVPAKPAPAKPAPKPAAPKPAPEPPAFELEVAHRPYVFVREQRDHTSKSLGCKFFGERVRVRDEARGWVALADGPGFMLVDGSRLGLGALLAAPGAAPPPAAAAAPPPADPKAALVRLLARPPVVPDAPVPAGCSGLLRRWVALRPAVIFYERPDRKSPAVGVALRREYAWSCGDPDARAWTRFAEPDGWAHEVCPAGHVQFAAPEPGHDHGRRGRDDRELEALDMFLQARAAVRAGKESDIPNFKGSSLGRVPLVSADFWTSDHLSERSRSVDVLPGTRARGTLTLKRR